MSILSDSIVWYIINLGKKFPNLVWNRKMIYIEIKSLKAEERIETLWDYAPFLSENENRITLKMEYEERCVEIKKEKNEK